MLPDIRNQVPGVHSLHETVENVVWWGNETQVIQAHYSQAIVVMGASRDDNHTGNTTLLRAGLLMAYFDDNGAWLPYDSAELSDEGGTIAGVLRFNVPMDIDGTDTDRHGAVIYRPGANIKFSSLYTNDAGGTAGAKAGLVSLGYDLDDWYHNN